MKRPAAHVTEQGKSLIRPRGSVVTKIFHLRNRSCLFFTTFNVMKNKLLHVLYYSSTLTTLDASVDTEDASAAGAAAAFARVFG